MLPWDDVWCVFLGLIMGAVYYCAKVKRQGTLASIDRSLATALKAHYHTNTLPDYIENLVVKKDISYKEIYPLKQGIITISSFCAIMFITRMDWIGVRFSSTVVVLLVVLEISFGFFACITAVLFSELFEAKERVMKLCDELSEKLPRNNNGMTDPIKLYVVEFLLKHGV